MDVRMRVSSSSSSLRRKKKKKKAAPPVMSIPDKMLRLVLLRLDSSACLVRAASTCKRWRAIIAADDFLRLSRTLHPPAIVGHYHLDKEPSEFVPFSTPGAAVEYPGSRFSSLDFLPAGKAAWEVADSLGGLVLLRQPEPVVFPDLVVCDPVARTHQGITHPLVRAGYNFADASLLAGGEDGGISMSNFRILYRFFMGPRACVFTAGEGGDWRELDTVGNDLDHFTMAHVAGRLNLNDGSQFCMGLMQSGSAILLDNASLEFSHIDLPITISTKNDNPDPSPSDAEEQEEEEEEKEEEEGSYSSFRVVHSFDGVTGTKTARIVHVRGEELEVFRQVTASNQWVLEHSVPRLSEACRGLPGYPEKKRFDWVVEVVANGEGLVVLSVLDFGRRWLFSVDVETMKMETVPERTYRSVTCPYTLPWPPVFTACVGQSRRRRR